MADESKTLVLRCYIEGTGDQWQALCVDLDLAAQGRTLHEVRATLDDMINSYLNSAVTYPAADRDRFLNRKSPFAVRMRVALKFFVASLFANRSGSDKISLICHHPCPA